MKTFNDYLENTNLPNYSSLFFFQSRLKKSEKITITKWYNALPKEQQEYVDILRSEAAFESEYFSQGD